MMAPRDRTSDSSNTRRAVYAGTFDPLTIGHLWMIEQGVQLFDHLTVAIGINPNKKPTFSVEERLELLGESTRHLPGVQISSFGAQFLIHYARSVGATHVLRGIRSPSDFEYERNMRNLNGDLEPGITSVFLMPPRDIAEVSSSMVKGLIGPEGWEPIVQKYVPPAVYGRLLGKFHDGTQP
jgi:pantetheine-phosphate adenylyltransferase